MKRCKTCRADMTHLPDVIGQGCYGRYLHARYWWCPACGTLTAEGYGRETEYGVPKKHRQPATPHPGSPR